MTTPRQKAAVNFCETCIEEAHFDGDIENFKEVSDFLSQYLDAAKTIAEDATESYYSNFDY